MRRTSWPGLLLIVLTASPLAAQFPRAERFGAGPKWWLSIWGGYQWSDRVTDPGSGADWYFDQAWSTRLTAEREVAPGISAGLAFNRTRLPLTYRTLTGAAGCPSRGCPGEATIASYGLTVRSGESRPGRFHLLTEGFLGAMQFSNFEIEGETAAALEAKEIRNTDFAYALGIGFGYGFARDWQGVAVFETANNIHERGEGVFAQRNARHYTTRVGLRVGF